MRSLGDDGGLGEDVSGQEVDYDKSAGSSGSIEDLELQLAQARAELEEYQRILNDLPGIYEGKFRQKLQLVTQQIRHLLDERKALQEQVSRVLTQSKSPEALPPAAAVVPPSRPRGWAEVRLPRFQTPSAASPSFRLPRLSRSSLRMRFPKGRSMGVALGAGIALTLLVLGLLQLLNRRPMPSVGGSLVPLARERSAMTPAASLRVEARGGPSWVLVERLGGGKVYDAILEPGQSQELAVGRGLKIRSGRPDLLYVGVGRARPVPLGGVSDLDWFEFRP